MFVVYVRVVYVHEDICASASVEARGCYQVSVLNTLPYSLESGSLAEPGARLTVQQAPVIFNSLSPKVLALQVLEAVNNLTQVFGIQIQVFRLVQQTFFHLEPSLLPPNSRNF